MTPAPARKLILALCACCLFLWHPLDLPAGNGSFLPGTWEIVPINKESPFPTDHYHVLSYVRNGTESGYITTYLYKMEYSFTGDGRGTLRAEVSGDGFASGMVTNHYTPGGWYLGSSATLDFFFEMTGTLSAQFSWKINAGGELELHLLNSSRKVTSKPLTEGFGRCEPTYLKRLMKELNSSYRSHPDVKKTEKVVNYNLEMLRDCANKVLNIMVDEEGKLFLLDESPTPEGRSRYWLFEKRH